MIKWPSEHKQSGKTIFQPVVYGFHGLLDFFAMKLYKGIIEKRQ